MKYVVLSLVVLLSACSPHGPLNPALAAHYGTLYVLAMSVMSFWFYELFDAIDRRYQIGISNKITRAVALSLFWPITFPISAVCFVIYFTCVCVYMVYEFVLFIKAFRKPV